MCLIMNHPHRRRQSRRRHMGAGLHHRVLRLPGGSMANFIMRRNF